MLIHNLLENSTQFCPEKTAVVQEDRKATYRQLNAQAESLAVYLQANGIVKGARIVLLLENSIEYVIAYYGTLKAGAVATPVNPGSKPDDLSYILRDLEPSAIITTYKSERLLKAVPLSESTIKLLIIRNARQRWTDATFRVSTFDEAIDGCNAVVDNKNINVDDLASIIYTSGSTGHPKGVMLSHKNIVSNTNSICHYLSINPNDIQMVVLPFFYVMGKSLLNTHIAAGATVIINNRFLYPADVVHQMIEEKVTAFSGVPSTYAYLLNRSPLASCRDKLINLRYCSQAGGHMAKSVKVDLKKSLPEHTKIVVMYGATEAAARLTYLDPSYFESKIESIGKPIPEVDIRLLDDNDHEVPDGEEGELVASGPNIMIGYWKAPQDTERVLNGSGYHTGDIGFRDQEGFLFLLRRKDELLKVSGHRINPIEVEDYLMATNMLIESAVVGLPDKLIGHKLIALIVPKDDHFEPKTLMEKCAGGLPKHKCPADIISIRALPKNSNGKIDREKCLALAGNGLN